MNNNKNSVNDIKINNNGVMTLSVNSVISFVTNSIHTDLDNQIIIVEGILTKRNNKVYDGYYYDYLSDINTNVKIQTKIPAIIRNKLKENNAYKFEGFVQISPYKDIYNILFTVTKLIEENVTYIDQNIKRYYEILNKKEIKINVDRVITDKLSKNELIKAAFIFGEGAITDKDVYTHLGGYKKFYLIDNIIIPLKVNNIINTLEDLKTKSYDLVALIRGGGNLDTFNDLDLVDYCSTYSIPLITSLGHTADHTYLDSIADKMFNTPTSFGMYLKSIIEDFINDREELKKKNEEFLRKDLEKNIAKQYDKLLEEKNNQFNKLLDERTKNFNDKIKEKEDGLKKLELELEKLNTEKNILNKSLLEQEKIFKKIEQEFNIKLSKLSRNNFLNITIIVLLCIFIISLLFFK
jgi:hypothetical protein